MTVFHRRIICTVIGAVLLVVGITIAAVLLCVDTDETKPDGNTHKYLPYDWIPTDAIMPEMPFLTGKLATESGKNPGNQSKEEMTAQHEVESSQQHQQYHGMKRRSAAGGIQSKGTSIGHTREEDGVKEIPEVRQTENQSGSDSGFGGNKVSEGLITGSTQYDDSCASGKPNIYGKVSHLSAQKHRACDNGSWMDKNSGKEHTPTCSSDRVHGNEGSDGELNTAIETKKKYQYIELDLDARHPHPSVKKEALNSVGSWIYYIDERENNAHHLKLILKNSFVFVVKTQKDNKLQQNDKILSVTYIHSQAEKLFIACRKNGQLDHQYLIRRDPYITFRWLRSYQPTIWKKYSLGSVHVCGKPILRIQLENTLGESLIRDDVESGVVMLKDDDDKLQAIQCYIHVVIPNTGIVQKIKMGFQNLGNYTNWKLATDENVCKIINVEDGEAVTEPCSAEQHKEAEDRLHPILQPSLQVVAEFLVVNKSTTNEMLAYTIVYHPGTVTLFAIRNRITVKEGDDNMTTTFFDMPTTQTYPTRVSITPSENLQWSAFNPSNAGLMETSDLSSVVARIKPYGTMLFAPFSLNHVTIDVTDELKLHIRPLLMSESDVNLHALDSPGYVDVHKENDAMLIDVIYVVALPERLHTDVVKLRTEVANGGIKFVPDQPTRIVALKRERYCQGRVDKHTEACILRQVLVQRRYNLAKLYTFMYDPVKGILTAMSHYVTHERCKWRIQKEAVIEKFDRPYINIRPVNVTVDKTGAATLQKNCAGDITATLDGTDVRACVRPEGRRHDMPIYSGSIEAEGHRLVAPYLESDDGHTLIDIHSLPEVNIVRMGDNEAIVHVQFQLQLADGTITPVLRLKFLRKRDVVYLESCYERRDHRPMWNASITGLSDDHIAAGKGDIRKLKRKVKLGNKIAVSIIAADVIYRGDISEVYAFIYDASNGHLRARRTRYRLQPKRSTWTQIGDTVYYDKPISGVRYVNHPQSSR